MKKVMIIEIVVLVALLLVAVLACLGIAQNGGLPGTESTTESTTAPQTTTEETTEPEPTWMTVPAGRQLLAQQYFVYDCQTDTFVTASADPTERVYPASVTKLLTAYVALQYLEPDELIMVGDVLELVAWGSSVAQLKKGDVLPVSKLIEAMLLPSGNDAAYVLATVVGWKLDGPLQSEMSVSGEGDIDQIDYIAGSSVDEARWHVSIFMEEMNRQAVELGMTGSHFVNPDGIHQDDHYMSFADLCLLGKLAIGNETIRRNAVIPKDTVVLSEGPVEWENTNKLIDPASKYYCPYTVGLKTGQTPTAGSCLLSGFEMDGKQWVIGVFGCPEEEDRFDDTLQLFNQTVGIG